MFLISIGMAFLEGFSLLQKRFRITCCSTKNPGTELPEEFVGKPLSWVWIIHRINLGINPRSRVRR